MDDRQIEVALRRLAQVRDDEAAWTTLYQRFRPYVYALAYRESGSAQDFAKEATQETFFRLVKYCPFERLTDVKSFRAYLSVVTRNVIAILGKEKNAETQMGVLGASELGEPVRTPLGETVELRQLLRRALAALGEEDQRTLSLRLEGYSLQEIAGRLGLSSGNAAVRLHRIRARLRQSPLLKDLI